MKDEKGGGVGALVFILHPSAFILPLLALALPLGTVAPVFAAGHHEITVVPIGSMAAKAGVQEVTYRLPSGPEGSLPQPVVFMSIQPTLPPEPATTAPAGRKRDEKQEPGPRVPATLTFTVEGQALPAWHLKEHFTAYVINLDTIRANPAYASGNLSLKLEVKTRAEVVSLNLFGMPDPLLLDGSTSGPLESLAAAAGDPDVKAYLTAMSLEIGGQKEAARSAYEGLRACKNGRVARFARRALRMLSYDLRKRKLSGNFMEHYRWGLYLQQCGLFSAAFNEFEECRIIDPSHVDSQYRAGETLERAGGHIDEVLLYMDRGIEATSGAEPAYGSILVVIVKSRKAFAPAEGGPAAAVTLTPQQVEQLKNNWLGVEKMVWVATNGLLAIDTTFLEVEDGSQPPLKLRDGPVPIPADDLIETRGWFDGVIVVRPRRADEPRGTVLSVGGDQGPNGAAVAAVFHDASWQTLFKAWYHMLDWAANVGEIGPGRPAPEQTAGCGPPPIPNGGYGVRAALRYYFTPAMLRRLKVVDLAASGNHVRLWKVEGPFPVQGRSAEGQPSALFDPIPDGAAAKTIEIVSDDDFIDLAGLFPGAGRARARCTSWVYSPEDQEVRMWLGQNDRMALWVNGQCVHEGRYPASGRYEDRNQVDTIASTAILRKGWNELRAVVESFPPPRDTGWGFSVRFCLLDNEPVPGLAYLYRRPDGDLAPAYAPPAVGAYYSWQDVKSNYHDMLPRLTNADLQRITGVKGLSITGAVGNTNGYVIITAPGRSGSATYRSLATPWQPEKDRDVVLNNLLDWEREACAAFRFKRGGRDHDLLILRPEAFEAYLTLLNEPSSSVDTFGKTAPADRLLGYVVVPAGSSTRTLLAVDCLLGDGGWPTDEEDLLTPFIFAYKR